MNSYSLASETWLVKKLKKIYLYICKHKNPICSSLIFALLSYTFAFTNKLVNHDEIISLFAKGATIDSGRWGLEITSAIFPDYSLPWIYGIISIAFITLSICIIIDIFSINNFICEILLSGLIISFPVLTGIFSYMFTSASFSFAFFLSILSVRLITSNKKGYRFFAFLSLIFSVSIYQAYISVTASLLVVFLLQKTLSGNVDIKYLVKKSLFFVFFLAISLGLYYIITTLILNFSGTEFNEYAATNLSKKDGIIARIIYAYRQFFAAFTGKFHYFTNTFTQSIHIGGLVVFLLTYISKIVKQKRFLCAIYSFVLLALLPLSVCCIYLFVDLYAVHSLMMYGFISLYVFAFMQKLDYNGLINKTIHNVFPILFSLCIVSNIYNSNIAYLRLHLAYENAYSYFSSVMTSITNTPGYDGNSKIAIYLDENEDMDSITNFEEFFDDIHVIGITTDLRKVYSREKFIQFYLGYDVSFATEEEVKKLSEKQEFQEMPTYPYYGSIKKVDNYIVVKLTN